MSSVTNKTELIAGGHIYRNYKDAMHLLDPDDVKEFYGTLRVLRQSMYRAVFDPDNEPYEVYWHHSPTAKIEGWVQTGFADNEYDDMMETFTEDEPDAKEIEDKLYRSHIKIKKHTLNKRVMSYLYMVEMHLTQYGDQAYANIGTILPNIPEALIGSVTNLKKMDIIEDPDYLRDRQSDPNLKPTTIRLHARDVIDLARANQSFTKVCWEEWEQTLLDPEHVIEFNKKGKISIDPVLETQIAHYLAALYDAFYANKIWQVYYKMQQIMENAETGALQFQDRVTKVLNETLEYIEAYNTRYTRELLEMGATTKRFNNMFADVKDNLDILEHSIGEDGILSAIKQTLENMHDEVDFIDEQIDEKLEMLQNAHKFAQTSKATIWKRIKEIEDKLGDSGVSKLVEKYMKDYDRGKVPSIKDRLKQLEEEERERVEQEEKERLLAEKQEEEEAKASDKKSLLSKVIGR